MLSTRSSRGAVAVAKRFQQLSIRSMAHAKSFVRVFHCFVWPPPSLCCFFDGSRSHTLFRTNVYRLFPQHLQSPDNNEETFFDFTEENYERANRILRKYPDNYRQVRWFISACIVYLLDWVLLFDA